MKIIRLVCLLHFLTLSVGDAQQTNSPPVSTNSVTVEALLAKAEKGDVAAEKQIAIYYYSGLNGLPKDFSKSLMWRHRAAEQGDTESELAIGSYYENGDGGVEQNFAEAVIWYRVAAGKDDKYAQFAQLLLAQMYRDGRGVTNDLVEAAKWYRKGAEQGDSSCQSGLGSCYYDGEGVKQDYNEAAKWFQKAAEQGDIDAQFNLGLMYDTGKGIAQDYGEAMKWYRKAADQGYADAQSNLGVMFFAGNGVPQNYAEALKWWRKAAEQGNSGAQLKLGTMFEQGEGVPQDFVEAYKWYNLSSAGGDSNGSKFRSYIAGKMTPEQVAEAQRRSAEFVSRKETSSSSSDNSTSPENPTASGSGFFITDDGYLISNYHVVKEATKIRLVTSAGTFDAKVVQVDAANDLALLKADGKFSPLPIAASRSAHLGGTVATIGFPDPSLQGFSPKLAKGEIASLSGAGDDPRYFQISVPVQPGNSGGALVDERGNVIGIVSAKLDAAVALAASGALPENVNYAVKSSLLLSFLESVPEVDSKLKEPNTKDEPFEDVVQSAQDAAVLVLVY